MQGQDEKTLVGFLFLNPSGTQKMEEMAAMAALSRGEISYNTLSLATISKDPSILNNIKVLWVHRPDSMPFTAKEKAKDFLDILTNYINSGGRCLLTLDAVKYLNILNFESMPLESWSKEASDNGYGRMLGIHGYGEHPVFLGLNGGSYINKPKENIRVRVNGFRGDVLPAGGKVIGVDWDYIFVREDKKILLEYDSGQGKVIACGAYMIFSQDNVNQLHLGLFLKNILEYLAGNDNPEGNAYWSYEKQRIEKMELTPFARPVNMNPPAVWPPFREKLVMKNPAGGDHFWDVAGRRMFLMGREKSGIEEVWAHPMMALRDYEAGIVRKGETEITWLGSLIPAVQVRPECFTRIYETDGIIIKEFVAVTPDKPEALIHYEFSGDQPVQLVYRFHSNFRLMWPYSEKVIPAIQYAYDTLLNAFLLTDPYREYSVMLGSNLPSSHREAGPYTPLNSSPADTFLFSAEAVVPLDGHQALDLILVAGKLSPDAARLAYSEAVIYPQRIINMARIRSDVIANNFLTLVSPDTVFNQGFAWAVSATDKLFVETPGLGLSLVAGYSTTARGWDGGHKVNGRPGYAWYFGRDGAWSAFAALDYGDFEGVRNILILFQDFQDLNGKIFHELSTSGFVHYDAADATPLYVILAGKYFRHTGDYKFIRDSWENIQKAIDYCYSTDTDGDLLIENTNVGHGWVEGGHLFGSHSSLYLTACWAEALDNAAGMAAFTGKKDLARKYRDDARIVKDKLNTLLWNENENFYYQGIMQDGSFHTALSIMPGIPLLFGQADTGRALPILEKFAADDYSSDWGVRITGKSSPHFNPGGYHSGSVWPLYTGWVALAEYRYARPLQAFTHVMNNLKVYRDWSLGYIEEVLHGSQYKPFGVCPHQAWSETMVIQPVVEGMLGFRCDVMKNKCSLQPKLPPGWNHLKVRNLRMGSRRIHMEFERTDDEYRYILTNTSDKPVRMDFSPFLLPGTFVGDVKINGVTVPWTYEDSDQGMALKIPFFLSDTDTVSIAGYGGISVLPQEYDPMPGDSSSGVRVLNSAVVDGKYRIQLEGPAGKQGKIRLILLDYKVETITGGTLENIKDGIHTVSVLFPEGEGYCGKEVVVWYR